MLLMTSSFWSISFNKWTCCLLLKYAIWNTQTCYLNTMIFVLTIVSFTCGIVIYDLVVLVNWNMSHFCSELYCSSLNAPWQSFDNNENNLRVIVFISCCYTTFVEFITTYGSMYNHIQSLHKITNLYVLSVPVSYIMFMIFLKLKMIDLHITFFACIYVVLIYILFKMTFLFDIYFLIILLLFIWCS